jgi:diphthine-ammonia ligase
VTGSLLDAGFAAVVVAVRDGELPQSLLGRRISPDTLAEIEAAGADACGENGEYHSFVVDGPIFRHAVEIEAGRRSLRNGVWFLDLLARHA